MPRSRFAFLALAAGCHSDGFTFAGVERIDRTLAIRAEFPAARIIVPTTFDEEVEARRAREAGASVYSLNDMPPGELRQVVRRVWTTRSTASS